MLASLLLAAAAPALPGHAAEAAPAASTPSEALVASSRPSIGFLSAAGLRDRCEANAAGLVSYCFAYITGVHDSVQAYETWLRMREFCAPYASSQGEMRRAFLSYLKSHPESEGGEAASVVVLALKDQYPCTAPGRDPMPPEPAAKAPAAKAPARKAPGKAAPRH